MLKAISSFDERLFLFLNGQHNSFFDVAMWLFSDKLFWIPLYLWFLWMLYKRYPVKYWTVLVTIIILIVASDQLCNLAKNSVMRLRPSQDPHLRTLVHVVNDYRGGSFGFYSGHASNAFALAVFIISVLGKKRKYIIPVSLAYATFTAYSRVYLGVHYPGDILTGAIIGSLLGFGLALAHDNLRTRFLFAKD